MSRTYTQDEWTAREIEHLKTIEIMNRSISNLVESLKIAKELINKEPEMKLNISLPRPIPPIDEQMKAIAHNGRCFGGHFDQNGDINYFMANLSYGDKPAVQDVITQNVNLTFLKINGFLGDD